MSEEAKTLTENNAEQIAEWCGGRAVVQHDALNYDLTTTGVNVPVYGRVERAQVGDTVIQKHDGSFRIAKRNSS